MILVGGMTQLAHTHSPLGTVLVLVGTGSPGTSTQPVGSSRDHPRERPFRAGRRFSAARRSAEWNLPGKWTTSTIWAALFIKGLWLIGRSPNSAATLRHSVLAGVVQVDPRQARPYKNPCVPGVFGGRLAARNIHCKPGVLIHTKRFPLGGNRCAPS